MDTIKRGSYTVIMKHHSIKHNCDSRLRKLVLAKIVEQKTEHQSNLNIYSKWTSKRKRLNNHLLEQE